MVVINLNFSNICINNLPSEILTKIFSFLTLKQKLNCESVCKYWQKLIYVNQSKLFVVQNNFKHYHQIEQNLIFFTINSEWKVSRLIEKCGKQLKCLHLEGVSFKSKNRNCVNLVKIIIDNCPNLNYLDLGKCKDIDYENFNLLLDKYGSQLSYFQYRNFESLNYVKLLVNKLNSKILINLGIDIPDQQSLNILCTKFNNLEKLKIYFFVTLDLQIICTLKKLKLLKLCNRQFNFSAIKAFFLSNNLINNLKTLKLNSIIIDKQIINDLYKLINLKFLKLIVSNNDELDCLLCNMKNLQSLSINFQIYPSIDNLSNLHKLTNLENLEIKCQNINLLKFDFEFVMPKLKSLTLIGTCYKKTFINKSNFLTKLPFIFPNINKLTLTDQWNSTKHFTNCLNQCKRLNYFKLYTLESSRNDVLKQFVFFKNFIKIVLVFCERKTYSDSNLFGNYHMLMPLYLENIFDN